MTFNEQLPSRALPYNFKAIEIVKLTPLQMTDFSEAIITESLAPAIEAIGATINVPVHELTFGDFYYLMTWHRFNSRASLPFPVSWDCENSVLRDIATGEKYTFEEVAQIAEQFNNADDKTDLLDPFKTEVADDYCGHFNATTLRFSDFKVVQIPGLIEDARFDFPRVKILDEFAQMQSNPRMRNIASVAAWLKAGDTLQDKIDILMSQPDLELFDAADIIKNKYEHGVSRKVHKPCERCLHMHEFNVHIGPQSFFA